MANQNIHILSLNVRGLRDYTKRQNIFKWLKGKDPDIVFLQETHCHLKKDVLKWSKEWSGSTNHNYWSLGTSRSKGVAILLSKNIGKRDIRISDVFIDPNGRSVKLILHINDKKYRLINIYAPNNEAERVKFFVNLHDFFNDNIDAETIIGGDFNCTMDSDNDRQNCSVKNDVGQVDLHYLSNMFDLEDVWRRRFPDNKEYTWQGRDRMSRIDYWLTSTSLDNQIEQVNHCYAPYTDHRSINLILRTDEIEQGKGIWKMNTSNILTDDFKEMFTEMWKQWQLKKADYNDINTWWDVGKKHIKNLTQNYSKELNIQKRFVLDELEAKLNYLNSKTSNSEELKELQREYETIHAKKVEGARIRSRIQWWEEGEKSTYYFHNLERRNGKDKVWDKIIDSEGNLQYGTHNIQKRQIEFYKELFKAQSLEDTDKSVLLDNVDKQLTGQSKKYMDSIITKEEISNAIKKMPNNKSPGQDGIPVEFYKVYWNIVSDDLLQVIHKGLNDKQLPYTQYLAVIVLLYKKGSRADIKNWRPISLLNVDYKILSKVLAERLKTVLPEIIHYDQRGCVPGRYIGENIRLIDDLLFEIENENENPVILMLDQEKAFDRVEWSWLFDTLKKYNFGDTFISWLEIIYKDAKSCIMTNGVQSEYFDISRGIRQGDSLSALLYIIQFEPLAEKLRTSSSIEGISVNLHNCEDNNLIVRGCQYVDDSNTMLKSVEYITNFLDIINVYEKASGSKMNLHKTVGLVIKQNMEAVFNDLRITTGPEKVLGIPLGKNTNGNNNIFWESLLKRMKTKLDIWKSRDLSLEGKTHLIRSIGVSQILYAIEMKQISEKHIKEVDCILWDFLWSGKRCTVSKAICTLPRHMGGLGLVDLKTLVKVKRVKWVIRFLREDGGQNWARLIENYLRCLDNNFGIKFFTLKVTDSSDLIETAKIPDFYKCCIKYFQELCIKGKYSMNDDEIIWCNDTYRFRGKTLSFAHWSKSGIQTKSQLYNDGEIKEQEIYDKLTHKAGFLFEMKTVKKVMPESCARNIEYTSVITDDKDDILQYKFVVPGLGIKCLKDLSSKDIYNIFLLNQTLDIRSKHYWCGKFGVVDFDWQAMFQQNLINEYLPRKCKDFNWKLFHGLVNTESRLKNMRYSDGLCKSCTAGNIENLEHLLIGCKYNKLIWKQIENIVKELLGETYKIDTLEIMLGFWSVTATHSLIDVKINNVIMGICRYHIWKMRNNIKYGNAEDTGFTKSVKILKISLESHFQVLILSSNTDENIKAKLKNVLTMFRKFL